MRTPIVFGLLCALLLTTSIRAAEPAPITLTVDAAEIANQRIEARLVIPVKPGPLTLLYPKWLPGTHGPGGPIGRLGGLKLSAGGKPVPWQRDPLEMFAFHCDVPAPHTAGDFFPQIPPPAPPPPQQIALACEDPKSLNLTRKSIAHRNRLGAESGALFGARHYTDFHFLLGLSDKVPAFGLEHHE